MEILLKQKFSYATINIVRNYSYIGLRSVLSGGRLNDEQILAHPIKETDVPNSIKIKDTHVSHINKNKWEKHGQIGNVVYPIDLRKKGNVRRKFFYSTDDTRKIYLPLVTINRFTNESDYLPYETTREKHIKRHYNNPFAGIRITTIERTIKKVGDKLFVSLYVQYKERKINSIYFTKTASSKTITFNLKTGNFLGTTYTKPRGSKATKNFSSNSFQMLEVMFSGILNTKKLVPTSSKLHYQFEKIFSSDRFRYILSTSINNGISIVGHYISYNKYNSETLTFICNFMNEWLFLFAKLRQIKLPDKGFDLLKYHYPGEKSLKKNERKLIASILDQYGMKSKITIKILHENPDIDLMELKRAVYLFGDKYHKYIANIPIHVFKKDKSIHQYKYGVKYYISELQNEFNGLVISEKEKQNIIKIIRTTIEYTIYEDYIANHLQYRHNGVMGLIYDHIKMLHKVKEYYPDRILSSTTCPTFLTEHHELGEIEQKIRKGWIIEHIYSDELIQYIENPIHVFYNNWERREQHDTFIQTKEMQYIIKILKNTNEYDEEGTYMHHCVGSYINNDRSLIVSIRYMDDRVTCEFDTRTKECVQARYFKNSNPPKHFEPAIEQLSTRIKSYPFSLKPTDKVKKRIAINGKEVPCDIGTIDVGVAVGLDEVPIGLNDNNLPLFDIDALINNLRQENEI